MSSTRHLLAVTLAILLTPIAPAQDDEGIETDLLIVGGTESGWAAAIQAARMGVPSVTIVHDGAWLGGQYTEQALACVDENKGVGTVGWGPDWHPMKRSFHRFGLFKELMDDIEAFNLEQYGSIHPGKPIHGPSTFRPAEAEAIFREMLQPYLDSGQVRFITNHYPIGAVTVKGDQGTRLVALHFQSLDDAAPDAGKLVVSARLTIDASDWGDAIKASGAAFEFGPDPRSRYGEPDAPADLSKNPPNEMNPITWAMIVERAEEPAPIPKPPHFDDRNYPRASKMAAAEMKDLPWDRKLTRKGGILHWPDAGAKKASPRQLSVYNVRRVVDGYTSKEGQTVVLLNYMNGQDYPLERLPRRVADALEATEPGASQKNIVLLTRAQREIIFADAKEHSLGVLYHLQKYTHERAPDKAHSFRNFVLSDEFGTPDRLPPKPYIREGLRLKAMYMMREQDGKNTDAEDKKKAREAFANAMYHDGLFSWQFHYDFHRTGRTFLKTEGEDGPWIDYEKPGRHTRFVSDRSVFPLRSLVPVEMDGLLGAQKNVGYSSIVSAAIRLHDQCIHIGQAAGAVAALCLGEKIEPREIPFDPARLEQVRHALCGGTAGAVPILLWPYRDLAADHPAFVAINRLAARGAFPFDRRHVDFRPDDPATSEWREETVRRSLATMEVDVSLEVPGADLTRGEFALAWWAAIKKIPTRPFPRHSATDADADGLSDPDDALPLDGDNDNTVDLIDSAPS